MSVWETAAYNGKRIRLTEGQKLHISFFHPEVLLNEERLMDPLSTPDIVTAGSALGIRVLYRFYNATPVSSKYLAVVVKELNQEGFIVTSYFTERIRRVNVLWKRAS